MTEHVYTRRCTAAERDCPAFRHTVSTGYGLSVVGGRTEPALGTLHERLGIIVRRLGGHTGPPRATQRELHDYADWCQEQGIPNGFDAL